MVLTIHQKMKTLIIVHNMIEIEDNTAEIIQEQMGANTLESDNTIHNGNKDTVINGHQQEITIMKEIRMTVLHLTGELHQTDILVIKIFEIY